MVDPALVGKWVRLSTTDGKEYSGIIFTYDAAMQVVVLQAPSAGGTIKDRTFDFFLLKLSYIKKVFPVSPPALFEGFKPAKVVPVSREKAVAREQTAIRAEKERIARIGKNVSPEAQVSFLWCFLMALQLIFDALAKTLPVSWSGDKILIMDQVIVAPPYTPESCTSQKSTSAPEALDRIRKVLLGERLRLNLQ